MLRFDVWMEEDCSDKCGYHLPKLETTRHSCAGVCESVARQDNKTPERSGEACSLICSGIFAHSEAIHPNRRVSGCVGVVG